MLPVAVKRDVYMPVFAAENAVYIKGDVLLCIVQYYIIYIVSSPECHVGDSRGKS
jgi:hypothetical protein